MFMFIYNKFDIDLGLYP